jgi:hypothetical protein
MSSNTHITFTKEQVLEKIVQMCPNASLMEDVDGQIVIYTNMCEEVVMTLRLKDMGKGYNGN